MATLVVNNGSSSLKLSLFEGLKRKDFNADNEKLTPEKLTELNLPEIKAIGHRIVHGGDLTATVEINDEVIRSIERASELAPLHNERSLEDIRVCREHFGSTVRQFAVFDTSFYSSLPSVAAHYALPYDMAETYRIKRYGFHGISHAFLSETYTKHTNNPKAKIITLHLGSGCSMTAIDGGVPLDTSMGFTPAEGLIMSTRAGDIDSSIFHYLSSHLGRDPQDVMEMLNNQSGLLGISGISSEMPALLEKYQKEDRAKLAIDMFVYRIIKYLGAYQAVLGKVEAIILSGGIGENSPIIRALIAKKFRIDLDPFVNEKAVGTPLGALKKISKEMSALPMYVIATDENGYIAKKLRVKMGDDDK